MRNKFRYWFDKQMAKGTSFMILMLSLCSFLIMLVISCMILALGLNEGGTLFETFWDIFATIVNAWMPYSDDGGIGYIIFTAMAALIGLLFTSVLIGIVGSAIEDRITQLRKGNSIVLEEGHVVVLGFTPGEYTLIQQLIESRWDEFHTIVIADDMEREEIEGYIHDNIEKSKNTNIICRSIDITDSQSLKCLSLEQSSGIVVNCFDNNRTIQSILAVRNVLREVDKNVQIIASVTNDTFLLPSKMRKDERIIMLQTNDMIARTIAHSCTQPGISRLFQSVFSFEGMEFYYGKFEKIWNRSFKEIMNQTDNAIPIGIYRNDEILFDEDVIYKETDDLLYFAQHRSSIQFTNPIQTYDKSNHVHSYKENLKIAIIGMNEVLDTILYELPDSVKDIKITDIDEELIQKYSKMYDGIQISSFDQEINEETLKELIWDRNHVVILNNHDLEEDEADMTVIMNLIQLKNIREIYNLSFSITAEMRKEKNRKLVELDETTDFIVGSDMASMILCQVSENPNMYRFFKELLSNEGNELYMKLAKQFDVSNRLLSLHQLRMEVLSKGYIFIGYQKDNEIVYGDNISVHKQIILDDKDLLIVIGGF